MSHRPHDTGPLVFPSAPVTPLPIEEIISDAGPIYGTPVAHDPITRIPLTIAATATGQKTEGVLVGVMAKQLDALEAELERHRLRHGADSTEAYAIFRDRVAALETALANALCALGSLLRPESAETKAEHADHTDDPVECDLSAYQRGMNVLNG